MAISPNVIMKKCKQAGVSFWAASEAAVKLKDEVGKLSEKQLLRKITEALKEIDEEQASQFEDYHSIKVRTSQNVIEHFNRKRITDSLVKETRMPKAVAEQIAQEVEMDIRRFQLKDISSSLIREVVNATLLQKKLFNAKVNYSRIGLPVYDIKKITDNRMEKNPSLMNYHFGKKVMEEYTLAKLMPKKIKEAHLNSDIYIHSLGDFITKPESIQNNLMYFLKNGFSLNEVITTGPAKKPTVAVLHAARALITSKNYASKGVGFDFFNILVAPYLKNKSLKEVRQTAQTFLYEINRQYYADNAFTINMQEEMPSFLSKEPAISSGGKEAGVYSDYQEEANKFMKVLLEVLEKGDYSGTKFKWPVIAIKYKKSLKKKKVPRGTYLIKQEIKNKSLVYNSVIENKLDASGVMQSVSINLPKLAKLSKDEEEFYEKLKEEIELFEKILLIKKVQMLEKMKTETYSFLSKGDYLKIRSMQNNLLLVGLPQATLILNNSEDFKKDELKQAVSISRFCGKAIRQINKKEGLNIKLGEGHDMNALTRFTSANKSNGVDMDISSGLATSANNEKEKNEIYLKMQGLFEAGAFYEVNSKKISNNSNFLYLKAF